MRGKGSGGSELGEPLKRAVGLPLERAVGLPLEQAVGLPLELESKRWVYRWDCGEKGAVVALAIKEWRQDDRRCCGFGSN